MINFYHEIWRGSFSGTDEELTQLLSRAADVINNEIALSSYTVDTVPDVLEERVKKAVCAQADYIDNNGGVNCMSESSGGSMSLGKFSYSESSAGSAVSGCKLCSQAESYLALTGLLYRGVTVI